ncbi:MAG: hypothetical protein ABI360_07985 [Allobranchiibius sp.]
MSDHPVTPRPTKTPIPKDKTGLSLWYRFTWRLEYWGVSVVGPAQQTLARDPKEKLRRERTRRVAEAREEQSA